MEASRLGIVGADRQTDLLVELLKENDRFLLAAMSNSQAYQPNDGSRTWDMFDDPREMILRGDLDMLMVWRGNSYGKFIELALDKGIWPVLRTAADGTTDSAGQLLRHCRKCNVGAFIWTPWTFIPSIETVGEYLTDEHACSIIARFAASDQTIDWPGLDNPLAALTYPSIFMIQRWMGMPDRVFCHETLMPPRGRETPIRYHCAMTLIYRKSTAAISASLNAGPDRCEFTIEGSGGTIEAAIPQTHWYDCKGKLVAGSENYTTDQAKRIGYERNLNALWQAHQERQQNADFELTRHIAVSAVLEAAALSAKTGNPEDPAKITDVEEILAG